MNITFMMGNGFDLGLGLKSRFSDFFLIYIAKSLDKPLSLKELSSEIGKNIHEWSYFERKIGKYASKFDLQSKNTLLEQFRDFETCFIEYLKAEVQNIDFSNKEKVRNMMRNAFLGYWDYPNLQPQSTAQIIAVLKSKKTEPINYNFISFNYTDLLEKCLDTFADRIIMCRKNGATELRDKIGNVVHVHGTLDSCPIMGVNDASQIENEQLAKDSRFVKYFSKPEINKANRTQYDEKATSLINNSDIICIYGMSLGETDMCWWKKVIAWLNAANQRQLIVFAFAEGFSHSSHFDWLLKEDEVIDTLASYAPSGCNVEKLRGRIHVAVQKNIFSLNLRNSLYERAVGKLLEEHILLKSAL